MIVVTGKVSVDQSPVRQSIYQQRMPNTLSSAEKTMSGWQPLTATTQTLLHIWLLIHQVNLPT